MINVKAKDNIEYSLPADDEIVYPITHEGQFIYLGNLVNVNSNTDFIGDILLYFFEQYEPNQELKITEDAINISIFVTDNECQKRENRDLIDYFYDDKYTCIYSPTIGTSYGDSSQITIFITPEDLQNEYWFVRKFMRKLLLYITFRRKNMYCLHASSVGIENEFALFLGDRGEGKSTLAINFLRNGMNYLSDDLVVRHLNDTDNTIWGEPWVTFVSTEQLKLYPDLKPISTVETHQKALINLRNYFPNNLKAKGNLSAVFIIEKTKDKGGIYPINTHELMAYLDEQFHVLKYPEEENIVEQAKLNALNLFDSIPKFRLLNGVDIENTIKMVQSVLKGGSTE